MLRVLSLAQIELYVPVPCCAETGAAGRLMSWQSVHANAGGAAGVAVTAVLAARRTRPVGHDVRGQGTPCRRGTPRRLPEPNSRNSTGIELVELTNLTELVWQPALSHAHVVAL